MKSKTTAVILAYFLGGFGAHLFYIGKTKSAVIRLVFFWTFIPTIISFVEAIKYLAMDKADWNGYVGQ